MIETALLVPFGVLIGVFLGSVGGGGSLLAVPALVYLGDQSVRSAQAGALIAVIVGAGIGLIAYRRRDQVRLRAGLTFGIAASVSSLAGSIVSRGVEQDVLLLAFVPVMLAGAAAMVGESGRSESSFRPWRYGVRPGPAARVIVCGLGVGWLIGLFGVGGGFVIVPALVIGLGFALPEAVGTSLLVIVLGSASALADRLLGGEVDWAVVLPFGAAVGLGVLIGSLVAEQISAKALTRCFAALVVATALFTAVEATVGLL